jgi:putative colanic acid biosynthesis acetyltransferase WcaF
MAGRSTLGPRVFCYNAALIALGAAAVVSRGAHLCSATHDYTDPHFRVVERPITIGPQSWVAADAFVGPGVVIGEGAIVGARAVAVKNIPPWTVWVGNPAKQVSTRSRVALPDGLQRDSA